MTNHYITLTHLKRKTISSNENSNDSLEKLMKDLSLNPAENINDKKKL